MDPTRLPVENGLVLASALLAGVIGVLAVLRRGHVLTTTVFAATFLAVAAFQASALAVLSASTPAGAREAAVVLARTAALAAGLGLALSLLLARREPWRQVRGAAGYLAPALAGLLGIGLAAGSPLVVREVVGQGGSAVIVLGTPGRICLMVLIVAMLATLMNLERLMRNVQPIAGRRLRPLVLALALGTTAELLVASGGLLDGRLPASWLVAASAPLLLAGGIAAMALARRPLSDLTVPPVRPVIYYSPVSLTLAGAFLLALALLARLIPTLGDEARRLAGLAFFAIAGGGSLLLMLSPRANRGIHRLLERLFFARRVDYRREWERVSAAITPGAPLEHVARQVEGVIRAAFGTDRVALYLRREDGTFVLLHGPPVMPHEIERDNALVQLLEGSPWPLVFRQAALDLDQIPAAAENRETIRAMAAAACAPLVAGERLVGLLWLSPRRAGEEYTFEDAKLLAAMTLQLAASLEFARLAEPLADPRSLGSFQRLSS